MLGDPVSSGAPGVESWQAMWENPRACATTLNAMLVSKYGEDALDWDPITVQMEIQDDFGVTPAEGNMNKIAAMQVLMTSSAFFEDVGAFQAVCNAVSNGDPFFKVFTPLQAEEIAIGLAVAGMNRDLRPFSYAIRKFVKISVKRDGFGEGSFPEIFAPVFARKPSESDVRRQLEALSEGRLPTASANNAANIDSLLRDRVIACLRQLDGLKGLTMIDDSILRKGVLRALGEDAGDVPEDGEGQEGQEGIEGAEGGA